jgi:regulator of protease activity HflC (stomatin/prohibitin superfamily)
VNIDAILFWQIHDPKRAALEITDYRQAILRVAQTTLREMIGSSPLSAILSERQAADLQLKEDIGRKTAEWGIAAVSVELRDAAIPAQLQDAMSRQAQAEREKQARIILASAEQEVAQRFLDAANIYAQNPTALQLRAMNIRSRQRLRRCRRALLELLLIERVHQVQRDQRIDLLQAHRRFGIFLVSEAGAERQFFRHADHQRQIILQ